MMTRTTLFPHPRRSSSLLAGANKTTALSLLLVRHVCWYMLAGLLLLLSPYHASTPGVEAASSSIYSYSGCDLATYYRGLNLVDNESSQAPPRTDLHDRIRTTQRRVLPYTSTAPDTWDGLIDVDGIGGSNNQEEVRLIYASDRYVPSEPHGTSATWNREHLWPKSAGVGDDGPDYTDIHHLRPSLWGVNAARSNKWFGECGVEGGSSECRRPAHELADEETETDRMAWLPPPDVRGDIARALFYMDLRYDGDTDGDADEFDLRLTDCPHQADDDGRINELGYLSQLLQWHVEDPVDEDEVERNDGVCERWQGNRNPFVDYPHLVEAYFGKPGALLDNGGGYAECAAGYDAPIGPVMEDGDGDTSNEEDNEEYPEDEESGASSQVEGSCNGLETGDVAVIAVGSDNPDIVALVALADIKQGTEVYITDNAWTGSKFRSNEGTIKLTVNADGGVPAGSVLLYGGDTGTSTASMYDWQSVAGSFSLSASGDTIIVYCRDTSDEESAQSDPSDLVFLSAISYTGEWMDENMSDETVFGSDGSALPPLEINGSDGISWFSSGDNVAAVTLQHRDNVWYMGPRSGTRDDLWASLRDETNWAGSNTDAPEMSDISSDFILLETTTSAADTRRAGLELWAASILAGAVVVGCCF